MKTCVLEPNGTFFLEGRSPSGEAAAFSELLSAVEKLSSEVRDLRQELKLRDVNA